MKKETLAIDTHNLMSMNELESLLKTSCETIFNNPKVVNLMPPVLIHSSPGVGKSSIVKQVAEDLGIKCVDVRLAEMESVDIRGLPSIDKEKGVMKWNAPDFWPREKDSKGIIFLDELTSCDKSCQVAAYELILDRKIGDFYKVPDGWLIVAAGNKTDDKAVATTMSSALANRFLHVEIEPDPEQWVKWAQLNNIHPSVVGFITYRPENLFSMDGENLERGWPSPRSWERVSQMCYVYEKNESMLRKVVYGLVGPGKGVEFMEFYKLNESFANVLDMMYGKIPIEIPTKNDQKYAFCSTLIYNVWRGKNAEDEEKRLNGFYDIVTALPSDFSTMCMMGAMNGNVKGNAEEIHKKLYYNKKYKVWAAKHGNAMRKRMTLKI